MSLVRRFGFLGLTVFAVVSTGCAKNPTIALPPPAASHMFVADLINGLVVFTQPVTATSAPAFTIPGAGTAGVAFDRAGNLYVSNDTANTIAVYTSPVSAASTPAFTIGPVAGAGNLLGEAFDGAGNLWVADQSGKVFGFAPPFSGTSAPSTTMTGLPFGPVGITFDHFGNMIVALYGASSVIVFRPPFLNGANVAAATIALPTGGGGVGIDTHFNLLAGQANGTIAMIKPPFATGSPVGPIIPTTYLIGGPNMCTNPATQVNPLCPAVESLNSAVDASGNLWVPYGGDGGLAPPPPVGPPPALIPGHNEFGIAEFSPAYSNASLSNIGLLQTGLGFPFSIAFGP